MMNSMASFAARLATFNKTFPAAKKRASDTKGGRKLKWPHQSPSPPQLAAAGFFYAPSPASPDNVTCFLCECNLDGWEEEDDPVSEHLTHSQGNCGWAVIASIEQKVERGESSLEDPRSETVAEARKATFIDSWPHEDKRGWRCKIEKMVDAGWYYCPTPESDDFVACLYCSLSLDGWEPKDDPLEEHGKRSPSCVFLCSSAPSKTSSKAAARRTSRASRLSTLSTQDIDDAQMSMTEPEAPIESSIISTTTTAKPKAAKTKSTKAAKKTQSKKDAAKKKGNDVNTDTLALTHEAFEPEDDDFSVKVDQSLLEPKADKKRKSDQIIGSNKDLTVEESQNPAPKRRMTRSRTSIASRMSILGTEPVQDPERNVAHDNDDQVKAPATKKLTTGRKRANSKSRKDSAAINVSLVAEQQIIDDKAIEDALELDLERPLTDDENKAPEPNQNSSGRRGTAKSKKTAKPTKSAKSKAITKRASKIIRNNRTLRDSDADEDEISRDGRGLDSIINDTLDTNAKKKTALQQARSAKVAGVVEAKEVKESPLTQFRPPPQDSSVSDPQANDPSDETGTFADAASNLPEVDDRLNDEPFVPDDESGDELLSKAVRQTSSSFTANVPKNPKKATKAKTEISKDQVQDVKGVKDSTKDVELIDENDIATSKTTSKQASKPSKANPKASAKTAASKSKSKSKAVKAHSSQTMAEITANIKEDIDTTPRPTPINSPQSSDAENHPPSSRTALPPPPPSLTNRLQSPQTVKIPLAEVTTPTQQSPTKRIISKVQSVAPWNSIDMEIIFHDNNTDEIYDKENVNLDMPELSSPQKQLTVEEYIYSLAQSKEAKLKAECERMVGRFEHEGLRALKAIEGIVST